MNPNPGSDEAIDAGCVCPVLDNCHGRFPPYGYDDEGRPLFIIREGCPIHAWPFTDAKGKK